MISYPISVTRMLCLRRGGYCELRNKEGDQKSKENEAEKKEKTEKPDPDAEAEDQIHGPGKEIFWNPICKAILDPR